MNKCALSTLFVCLVAVVAIDGTRLVHWNGEDVRSELMTVIDKRVRSFMNSPSVQSYFKSKCAKNPEVNSYDKTQDATDDLLDCVGNVIDSTSVKSLNVTRAQENINKKAFFKRFCSKSEDLMGCARDFASILNVCFDKGDHSDDAEENTSIVQRIMTACLLFSCSNKSLMSYFKKTGSVCIDSKRDALRRCGEPIDNYLKNGGEFSSHFTSSFGKDQCGMMSNTQQCVANELSKCERQSSAIKAVNYFNSLFNTMRDMSPCTINPVNNYSPSDDEVSKPVLFEIFSAISFLLHHCYRNFRMFMPPIQAFPI